MGASISEFRGEYYFLSNFYSAPVTYNGMCFENNEAAFQAAKCPERMTEFCRLNPSEAKRLGRRVELRGDWEAVKDTVMYEICKAKFSQNPDFMTVKEYNRDFLPRIQRAREFVSLFESAINHMDDARVDKEEVRKQFRIRSWSEETKQTILIALAHYKKYEGLDKIESMEIIHCPTCGHHINIQSNGTTGYCPICDEEVST